MGFGVSLLLADHVDRLGMYVIGHQDRRLGLFKLLRGPEGAGGFLLPVSIEIVVVVGGGVRRQADVQPLPKLCELQERSAGTYRCSYPKLVRKRFPNELRFGFPLLLGSNRKSAL